VIRFPAPGSFWKKISLSLKYIGTPQEYPPDTHTKLIPYSDSSVHKKSLEIHPGIRNSGKGTRCDSKGTASPDITVDIKTLSFQNFFIDTIENYMICNKETNS